LLVAAVPAAGAATRPRYGGTLRVETQARIASLDPREWPAEPDEAARKEKVVALVFERLVKVDDSGRPQAQLAASWQHDAERKRWQFRLRPDVKFHDGTPLGAAAVVAALAGALDGRRVSALGETVVITSEAAMPDLVAELGRGRNFIFRRAADGVLVGTGPFRVAEWQPGRRALLSAQEDYWGGRAFLESIEIRMGSLPREQLINLELGRADVVEVGPGEIRRAAQSGRKVWSSAPVELLAVVFAHGGATEDARVREALGLSIDRAALHNVLLQKQGEPAGGLLPQAVSGYAFLFSTAVDLVRARRLWSEASRGQPLALAYDPGDPVARAIAERIAVNAREAGIAVQAVASDAGPRRAEAVLVRMRIGAAEPRAALASLSAALDLDDALALPGQATLEQLYAAERDVVESFRVVPLVHLPETYGLSARVKNWLAGRWGRWRLEDVWLEAEER